MKTPKLPRWTRVVPVVAAAGLVATFAVTRESIGSDHQDTPHTELFPRHDINDVYVFPGGTDQRIAIAVTFGSPSLGFTAGRFDPNALYQIKVDNNGDAVEDVVFQFSFDNNGAVTGGQTFDVIGPVPSNQTTEGAAGAEVDRFSTATVPAGNRGLMLNTVHTALTSPSSQRRSVQAFAGTRDDPFYIDLEQFFRILPDRRPTQGPLSLITGGATAFRPACPGGTFPANPAPFDATRGCAVDALRGQNTIAIVIEVDESDLTFNNTSANAALGIWATVSK